MGKKHLLAFCRPGNHPLGSKPKKGTIYQLSRIQQKKPHLKMCFRSAVPVQRYANFQLKTHFFEYCRAGEHDYESKHKKASIYCLSRLQQKKPLEKICFRSGVVVQRYAIFQLKTHLFEYCRPGEHKHWSKHKKVRT